MTVIWDIQDDGEITTVHGFGLPDGEAYAEIHFLPIPPNESTSDSDAALHRTTGTPTAGEVVFRVPDSFAEDTGRPCVVVVAAVTAPQGGAPGKAVQIAESITVKSKVLL